MELILLEKIPGLGALGSVVKVRPGYGRNFLIPQKKAVRANKDNLAKFETERAAYEAKANEQLAVAKQRASTLEKLAIEIKASASEEGKLYGSVGPREISDAIKAQGVDVQKSEIRMPHGAFRQVGEYEVEVQLHSDVEMMLKVNVVSQA